MFSDLLSRDCPFFSQLELSFLVTKARLSYAQELVEKEVNQPSQQRLNMSLQRKRKVKKVNVDTSATRKESVTLTFVTLEEKMRRLRSAAASKGSNDPENISAEIIEGNIIPGRVDINRLPQESSRDILVDMNYLYQTIFVNVREHDPTDPLHRIINRSSNWVVSLFMSLLFDCNSLLFSPDAFSCS